MATFDHGYALLVGVGADLPFSIRDSQRVAALLKDPSRCGYLPENVRLLRGEEANRTGLLEGLAWLARCAREDPQATIVFYYSGHGLARPRSVLALHPCFDAAGKFLPEACATEGLGSEELCQGLAAIRSSKLVVLLDCCYAGAQVETFKDPGREPDFLDRLLAGAGRIVLASSAGHELSASDQRESFFTAALLEGLAGYGSYREDGYAKIYEIVDWVQREVRRRSRERQHPIFRGSDINENFPVAFYAGGDATARDLGLGSRVRRRQHLLESQAEKAAFAELDYAREDLLLLQNQIAAAGSPQNPPLALRRELARLERKAFEAEGKLGLLEQQAPFYLQLARWWTGCGTMTAAVSLIGYFFGTQSSLRGPLFNYNSRGSVSVLGMLITSLGLFLLLAITEVFLKKARGPWHVRLPAAFDFKTLAYEKGFGRAYQTAFLLLFFLLPLVYQRHCLVKIFAEDLWSTDRAVDLEIGGWKHWTRYFPLADSLFGDHYILGPIEILADGRKIRHGITYFPFWGTWFLTISYACWVAGFLRLLARLAAAERDDGYWPRSAARRASASESRV